MNMVPRLILFTDLDGTLLSATTYDSGPALPYLARCRAAHVPVIFCSSKTAAEMIVLRTALKNVDPFICENGGAIYLPRGTFSGLHFPRKRMGDFEVIEIGAPVSRLRQALREAATRTGTTVKGMGEMTLREVRELTGLDEEGAILARQRAYDEPFVLISGDPALLKKQLRAAGYTLTRGGRFFHITQGCDKGKAVRLLRELYERKINGPVSTAGIGDAENDYSMFQAVDRAFLVQKAPGRWASIPDLPHLERVDGIGPEGWARVVEFLLKEKDISAAKNSRSKPSQPV